jgi:hypothetical protein
LDTQANQDPLVNLQLTHGSSFLKIKMGTQNSSSDLKNFQRTASGSKTVGPKIKPDSSLVKLYMKG